MTHATRNPAKTNMPAPPALTAAVRNRTVSRKERLMSSSKLFVVFALLTAIMIPGLSSAQQVHLLIITPYDFVDELQPLKNWKDETGRPTTIVTLGEIEEIHLGEVRDQPEKVKKFIADFVATHNTPYVMLAGDSDRFPVRYIKALNTHGGSKYYPSDLYYMDLWDSNGDFDDWNGNGNWEIGEFDVAGGSLIANVNLDDIDMKPDVAVARVPASTDSEMATFVNKVIDYESSAHMATWFRNALLVVDGGTGPYGSPKKMDAVVPSLDGLVVSKLYKDSPPYNSIVFPATATEINNKLNQGVGFMSYYGHGNRTMWAGWYDDGEIAGLTNSKKLPIIFATSCFTGRFHFNLNYYLDRDGSEYNGGANHRPEPMPIQPSKYDVKDNESMAEHFLVKNATGAVGYIGATSGSEHGAWLEPNKGLNPYFYEEYESGVRVLGDLWRGAIDRFIVDLNDPITGGQHHYSFWQMHKYILFGDPSLWIPQLPLAKVTVNGDDGPLTVSNGTTVAVEASLEGGSFTGSFADWWMLHEGPNGWSWWLPGTTFWLPGMVPSIQAPIGDVAPMTVFNQTLIPGTHRFYFGVDSNANGVIDLADLFYDSVEVTVN